MTDNQRQPLSDEFVQQGMAHIRHLNDVCTQVTANLGLAPEDKYHYHVTNIVCTTFAGHMDDEDIVEKATADMQQKIAAAHDLANSIGEPDAYLALLEVMFTDYGPKE